MAAQATTKLQVNYKLADGTLLNIYADDAQDLGIQLAGLQEKANLIADTARSLGTNTAVATVQATLGGTVVPSDVTSSAVVAEGHCKHGKLVWRESKPGADRPWKGWFCPSPKGTPDQCPPKFSKQSKCCHLLKRQREALTNFRYCQTYSPRYNTRGLGFAEVN